MKLTYFFFFTGFYYNAKHASYLRGKTSKEAGFDLMGPSTSTGGFTTSHVPQTTDKDEKMEEEHDADTRVPQECLLSDDKEIEFAEIPEKIKLAERLVQAWNNAFNFRSKIYRRIWEGDFVIPELGLKTKEDCISLIGLDLAMSNAVEAEVVRKITNKQIREAKEPAAPCFHCGTLCVFPDHKDQCPNRRKWLLDPDEGGFTEEDINRKGVCVFVCVCPLKFLKFKDTLYLCKLYLFQVSLNSHPLVEGAFWLKASRFSPGNLLQRF